jgi:short-subunit dehydrogenase
MTGMSCLLVARQEDPLNELSAELETAGGVAKTLAVDVTHRATGEVITNFALNHFGRIDVLVNNAGRGHHELFERMTGEEISDIVDVNLISVLTVTRAAVRVMIDQRAGTIINVASAAGVRAFPTASVYSAAKYGVVGFSSALRRELFPRGINVLALCPDYIESTKFFESASGRHTAEPSDGLSPRAVVRQALEAAASGRPILVLPRAARWNGVVETVAPARGDRQFKSRVKSFIEEEAQ